MIKTIKNSLKACSKNIRKKIFFMIFIIFNNSLLEFINIGLIGFLLLLITDQERILNYAKIHNINILLTNNLDDFSKFLALFVVFVSICSGFLRSFCVNSVSNLSAEIGSFLVVRFFRNIIFQDVIKYYSIDKNKVLNTIYNTNIVINTIIQPLFMVLIGTFSFLFISIGTIAFAPKITCSLLILIITLYILLSLKTKKRLSLLSNDQDDLIKKRTIIK